MMMMTNDKHERMVMIRKRNDIEAIGGHFILWVACAATGKVITNIRN
jgi:hypothetical protein